MRAEAPTCLSQFKHLNVKMVPGFDIQKAVESKEIVNFVLTF